MRSKLLYSLAVALAAFIILASLFSAGVFLGWEYKLSDSLYTAKAPLSNIIIIAIDDNSLQEIGRWPWPREVFAKALPLLNESKVIGVDVAFFEPYDKKADAELGNALSRLNAVIPIEFADFDKKNGTSVSGKILKPIAELENRSDTGFINIFADSDGIARIAPLTVGSSQSFALKIVQKYLDKNITYGFDRFIINFIGPPKTFRTVSFADVYYGRSDIDFKNKIVLIGATAPDLHDDFFVPTSQDRPMVGVEVHASAIQTLLTKRFLNRQGNLSALAVILALAAITALLLCCLRFLTATVLSAALFVGYLFLAVYSFDKGIIMNIVYPFLAIAITYVGITILFYFSEGKERRRIKSIFSKYVSKDVVNEILSKTKSDRIDLNGEEKDVTVIFADIRGFTSMSENMKPHEVVAMLNKYLGGMTEPIFENKGTLDKYIGDCIMAIFGAPLADKNHCLNAVKAAVKMRDKIVDMQKGKKKKVGMGIGINSGVAVIGSMGSVQMASYTAIGDTVNTASRLCSKAEAGQVIISEETYQRISDKIKARSLGEITVKGKVKPIRIYDVISVKE